MINFTEQLNLYFPAKKIILAPATWQEAFSILRECIDSLKGDGKKVIFFDELPWLDSHKSGFLSAFGYFWNVHVAQRSDILVVICGSAASWIIDKVVNNKGGLHNRITQRIRLLPFTLKETENYLKQRNINLEHYQILQLYMVMGGVPDSLFRLVDEFSLFYLKFMQKGEGHNYQKNDWLGIQKTQAYIAWCGYAFENICMKHINPGEKSITDRRCPYCRLILLPARK